MKLAKSFLVSFKKNRHILLISVIIIVAIFCVVQFLLTSKKMKSLVRHTNENYFKKQRKHMEYVYNQLSYDVENPNDESVDSVILFRLQQREHQHQLQSNDEEYLHRFKTLLEVRTSFKVHKKQLEEEAAKKKEEEERHRKDTDRETTSNPHEDILHNKNNHLINSQQTSKHVDVHHHHQNTNTSTTNKNDADQQKAVEHYFKIGIDGLTTAEHEEFMLLRKILFRTLQHNPTTSTTAPAVPTASPSSSTPPDSSTVDHTNHSSSSPQQQHHDEKNTNHHKKNDHNSHHHHNTKKSVNNNNVYQGAATRHLYKPPPPPPARKFSFPIPQAPTAEENAAELKRLRLIRESIARNETVLAPSIFKKPIPPDRRYSSRKRRPVVPVPDPEDYFTNQLHCRIRERVAEIPSFTRKVKNVRPKYAVISLVARSKKHNADNTTRRSIMHEYSFLNKLQYCRLHGYDFIVEDETSIDVMRPPHWSKVRVLRKWLPFYDWIVWVDLDVLFTNWERKIEDLVGDDLTRYLLADLKTQEENIAKARQGTWMKTLGSPEEIERMKVNLYWESRKKIEQARKRGEPIDKYSLKVPSLQDKFKMPPMNVTSNDTMEEFKMKQIDLILTHDFNGWNSGVMFMRNSWWMNNFLRRVWGVPSLLTKPYFDQGAFKYLLSPGFRGRNAEEGRIDANHLWDTADNTFNANHENFILREYDMGYRWEEGDWMMHLASCKSYSYCLDWFRHYYLYSMCNNSVAFDPPLVGSRAHILKTNNNIHNEETTKKSSDAFAPTDVPQYWSPPSMYLPPNDTSVEQQEDEDLLHPDNNNKTHEIPTLPPLDEEIWDVSGIPVKSRGAYMTPPPPPPPTAKKAVGGAQDAAHAHQTAKTHTRPPSNSKKRDDLPQRNHQHNPASSSQQKLNVVGGVDLKDDEEEKVHRGKDQNQQDQHERRQRIHEANHQNEPEDNNQDVVAAEIFKNKDIGNDINKLLDARKQLRAERQRHLDENVYKNLDHAHR